MDTPICEGCHQPLIRVDHVGIEHLVLDGNVYREAHALEGVASEIRLRCGNCGAILDDQGRKFFYERWWKYLEFLARNG